MKILLIAIGTRGDVQPFVAVGSALRRRGHTVSIAAAAGFSDMIATANLAHCVLPMDFQELLKQPEMLDAIIGLSGKIKAFRWAKTAMNEQLDALWRIGQEVAPDLILNHFKGSIAPYIARSLSIPAIPLVLQPGFAPTREHAQFLISGRSLGGFGNLMSHKLIHAVFRIGSSRMISRWRGSRGLEIDGRLDTLSGYTPQPDLKAPRIHAYSSTIVPRPADWPANEIQTGYPFFEPEPFVPSKELSAFLNAGQAPVYLGFGSMPGIKPARLADAVCTALARLGLRAIIATGWGALRELKSSTDFHVLEAAPHHWLFPQMAAVVHHGGSGTTHEALRWGRASVICPVFADQPFFGQRIAALGAGPPPISQRRLSADRLTKALEVALSPGVAARAAALGVRLREEDGVKAICDLIDNGFTSSRTDW